MTIKCINWYDAGIRGGGRCKLNLFGGRPSHGVCLEQCDQYSGPKPCARCWNYEHTEASCPIPADLSREQAAQNIRDNVGGCNC